MPIIGELLFVLKNFVFLSFLSVVAATPATSNTLANKPEPPDVSWPYAFMQFVDAWRETPVVTQVSVILGIVIIALAIVFKGDKFPVVKKFFGKDEKEKPSSPAPTPVPSIHVSSDSAVWEHAITELNAGIGALSRVVEKLHEQLEKDNDKLKSLIAECLSTVLDLTNEIRKVRIIPLDSNVILDANLNDLPRDNESTAERRRKDQ